MNERPASLSVERELGMMQATLIAHEARMDRNELAHAADIKAVHARFDGVKAHLDSQDKQFEKINLLLSTWMGRISVITAIAGFLVALGLAAVDGHWKIFPS